MTDTAFSSLALSDALRSNLDSLGYTHMTAIQQQSLPHVLAGRDLIAKAKTGSGKTAAFGLGVLEQLNLKDFACQALILCPTRELASQVASELRRLARPLPNVKILTLCGGTPIGPQIGSLEHGAHVVVGTPGRIEDHLRKQTLSLARLNMLVLDEADRMLDMGFYDTIEGIIRQAPAKRQTLLFSATYPEGIKNLSASFQQNPLEVSVESNQSQSHIRQLFFAVPKPKHKAETLLKTLGKHKPDSCLIFARTKQGCAELAEELQSHGHSAIALHGDLDQKQRDLVLVRFSNRSARILVATDVAARGLDIDDLQAVINYDLPSDTDIYVHRVGRTGRAGKGGLAISLLTEAERHRFEELGHFLDQTLELTPVQSLPSDPANGSKPDMVTLMLDEGRKNKLRPGDILGALTGDAGIPGHQVGKIDIFEFTAYVAIERQSAKDALRQLQAGKIKGRSIRVRRL